MSIIGHGSLNACARSWEGHSIQRPRCASDSCATKFALAYLTPVLRQHSANHHSTVFVFSFLMFKAIAIVIVLFLLLFMPDSSRP